MANWKPKPGSLNPNWRGGRRYVGGYVLVHRPEHPFSDEDGYVFEHRIVLEGLLGRYLLPGEVSHHINGIKDDNREENLVVYANHSLHIRQHSEGRVRDAKGQFVATT